MEILEVAKKINLKIVELENLKKELPSLAQKKSEAMVTYEKELAKQTLTLSFNNPVSIVDKLAKGNCADLKGQMDLAECMYKNALKIIDITTSQMMGFQSIQKHLSEI